ncbi:hypothetical protein [Pseudooceanicola nanhaiensis]|uniref:hypothetical protein n=1 Tax=Pseudooceanicola nanhaiensis TaxID=375761 RepID=UPI001CD68E9C|nr:hypothetical protein [Pseudooceanicola nanhaiensis]MCA0919249.1 hypothetical protein [Pseudooceanicola nanhaiensis]
MCPACAPVYEGQLNFSGARNIANLYALVAQDIRTGSRMEPSLAEAAERHEILNRIETSAASKG